MTDGNKPTTFELTDALREWCSQDRVAALRAADTEWRQAIAPSHGEMAQIRARYDSALAALLDDLRRRLESGEILLRGVQTAPVRQAAPSSIPGSWAVDMVFGTKDSTIECGQYRWIAVRAARPDTAGSMIRQPAAENKAESPERTGSGGRPTFPIEDMVAIVREGRRKRLTNNKSEADALLAAFALAYPGVRAPAHRTVVDHVAEIYRTAEDGARPLNP
jgi:hypothetical protein